MTTKPSPLKNSYIQVYSHCSDFPDCLINVCVFIFSLFQSWSKHRLYAAIGWYVSFKKKYLFILGYIES